MSFSVSIDGTDKLEARLRALRKTVPSVPRQFGLLTVAEAKRLVPRKTGNLGRRIILQSATRTEARVVASTPYAAAVEFGSRPHVIRPRRGRYLAFPAKGSAVTLSGRLRKGKGGKLVFARAVRHPGTRAQPYLLPGARRAVERLGLGATVIRVWNRAA